MPYRNKLKVEQLQPESSMINHMLPTLGEVNESIVAKLTYMLSFCFRGMIILQWNKNHSGILMIQFLFHMHNTAPQPFIKIDSKSYAHQK